MANIAVVAAQVGLVDPEKAYVKSYIAGVTITKGQTVYITTAGLLGLCDANDAGKQQFRGIALNGGGAGQAIDVLHDGEVYGFGVSGLNVGAFVYASNDVGVLEDGAGAMTVRAGRVSIMADGGGTQTKVLHIFTSWDADWA
jgi:hypothetical protein